MAQLTIAVAALERNSSFAQAYAKGINKKEYWGYTFEDSMDLIAKLPTIAARIYQNVFKGGKVVPTQKDKDYSVQLCQPARLRRERRLHRAAPSLPHHPHRSRGWQRQRSHHPPGWQRSQLPFLSLAAGLNGLAGPLHGLANQEVLNWLTEMKKVIGDDLSDENIKKYLWSTLNAGRVVPGYGHAVLRKTDPALHAPSALSLSVCVHRGPALRPSARFHR